MAVCTRFNHGVAQALDCLDAEAIGGVEHGQGGASRMNFLGALACVWDLRRPWIVPSTLWIGRLKV